jgi:hypothetical protein
MSYDFEPLDTVVRGWVTATLNEAEQAEFDQEYGEYLDAQDKDFDEEAYIKYMEQEEAAFIKSLVNPALV